MKKIKLTQGQYALVDDADYEYLNQFKWYALKAPNTFYVQRNSPIVNGKRHMIKMHHVIMGRPSAGFETDHRNGNGLDNQRRNLRFITHRQNGQNLIHGKKSSQYPGVHWATKDKKWITKIQINGKNKFLGYFTNEFKAFEVYRQAVEAIGEEVMS